MNTVLLLVRDARLRPMIEEALRPDGWCVEPARGLDEVWRARPDDVALVDWGMMGGLLTEAQRDDLRTLARGVPVVVIVPWRWSRLVTAQDLGVGAILARPFGLPELMDAIESARRTAAQELSGA